jgi:4'-phosphopantetheinyl transferase
VRATATIDGSSAPLCVIDVERSERATGIDGLSIWMVALDTAADDVAAVGRVLSADECGRATRFRFERDRRRFVACRTALRVILGEVLAADPREVAFTYSAYGKPALAGPAHDAVRFNVSHADGLGLIAVTHARDVGIDIERIRMLDDLDRLSRTVFSAAELSAFDRLPASARCQAFFNGWTRKEAYIKALGDGLQRPLDGFDVTLSPDEPARLIHVRNEPDEPVRWHLDGFVPAQGYVAALCVERVARAR